METLNTYYDIDFELWERNLRIDRSKVTKQELCNGNFDCLDDVIKLHPDWFIDTIAEELAYREENEPKVRAYFKEHFEGKTWSEIDGDLWSFYSDWHKDVFGYRPHGIVCGEYINIHAYN